MLFDDPDLGIETAMTHARQRGAQLFTLVGRVLGRDSKSFVHLGIALAVWTACTVIALLWVRRRGLRMG